MPLRRDLDLKKATLPDLSSENYIERSLSRSPIIVN